MYNRTYGIFKFFFILVSVNFLILGFYTIYNEETKQRPKTKHLWTFVNDPNPAMQFTCKYLNMDFRRCQNWEMVCTISKAFGVHQCIILHKPKLLHWSKK